MLKTVISPSRPAASRSLIRLIAAPRPLGARVPAIGGLSAWAWKSRGHCDIFWDLPCLDLIRRPPAPQEGLASPGGVPLFAESEDLLARDSHRGRSGVELTVRFAHRTSAFALGCPKPPSPVP